MNRQDLNVFIAKLRGACPDASTFNFLIQRAEAIRQEQHLSQREALEQVHEEYIAGNVRLRSCLGCGETFASSGPGNRICGKCNYSRQNNRSTAMGLEPIGRLDFRARKPCSPN